MANIAFRSTREISQTQAVTRAINTVLQTANTEPLNDCLREFTHRLNSGVISQVIRHQKTNKNPELALRFFRWASLHFPNNPSTYSAIIDALLTHNRLQDAESVVRQCNCKFNTDFIPSKFIKAHGDEGNIPRAMHWFRSAMKSEFSYNGILSVLVKKSEYHMNDALVIFDEMITHKIPHGSSPYSIIIKGLCRAGRVDDALKVFDKMPVAPNVLTYNVIIDGLCKRNCVTWATKIFERMVCENGVKPDVFTYGSLINGNCMHGKVDKAIEYLHKMEKTLKPNVAIYNAVINGLSDAGCVDQAMSMKTQMLLSGITPDLLTYTALVKGFCKLARLEEAELGISESLSKGICPNSITYGYLVNGYCSVGMLDEALRILDQDSTPPVFATTQVVRGLCEAGRIGERRELFVDWVSRADLGCFNTVLHGLCFAKRMSQAEEVVKTVFCKGYFPNAATFMTMLIGYCKSGCEEKALCVFDMMLNKGFFTKGDKGAPAAVALWLWMKGLISGENVLAVTKL